MNTITIPGLIRRFEDRVHHFERYQLGEPASKEPHYPMVVLFFGEKAQEECREVALHLYSIWPSYQNELLFLKVADDAGNTVFSELYLDSENTVQSEQITSEKLGSRVSALFGLKSHFQDRSRLLVFNVIDTTQFRDAADFEHWTGIMREARGAFVDPSLDVLDMLFLLLNENIGERQAVSAKIKNALGRDETACYSTLLLSNRRSDHAILEDWESCYRIIANTIALTNNNETQVASALFKNGVYTAAYACEEKPVATIGQVIIKKLIERLSKESFGDPGNLLSDRQAITKLGLSQERTIELLDRYAEQNLFRMLPSAEQLQYFPRKECEEYEDLSVFSEKEFNALTMDGWGEFLGRITETARENVRKDAQVRSNWKTQYTRDISAVFSINDLIWLRDHSEDVKAVFSSARSPSQDVQVLSAARAKLKYMLSSNAELSGIFVEAIQELGNNAEAFVKEWNQLLRSGLSVHSVRDENITQFYTRKVQNFFDHNGTELSETFKKITDVRQLTDYLYGLIDKIIESDAAFSAPFEEELESRLQEEALPTNAKQYIRQKLTGENVPIYYQAQFSLGIPVASCILIKIGTQLYANLVNHLSDMVYYYDKGSGNSAEALNYYEVTADNLICEEG